MDNSTKYILGIGNPIIDISATVSEDTIKKFSLDWGKTVFANDSNVGFFDALESQKDVTLIPGGSVTNSLRICSWMLKNNASHKCMMLGCIGNDNYANELRKELNKSNVFPLLEINDQHLTSRCGVGIYLKERCLMPQIRASTHLSMDFVHKNIETIDQSEMLFIEGYFVIEKYDIVKYLAKHFHEKNKKVAFTLSATFMIDNFYEKMLEISNQSNLVICNNEEAEAFTKITSSDYEKVSLEMHKILKPLDRIIIITCGKDPVIISKYNYEKNTMDYLLKSYVYHVSSDDIVDTNGCGDSFIGAFLSQYIQGKGLEECSRAGIWASSVILRNIGCTYPDELEPEF